MLEGYQIQIATATQVTQIPNPQHLYINIYNVNQGLGIQIFKKQDAQGRVPYKTCYKHCRGRAPARPVSALDSRMSCWLEFLDGLVTDSWGATRQEAYEN